MDAATLHIHPRFSPTHNLNTTPVLETWISSDYSPGDGLRQVMLGPTENQALPALHSIFSATIEAHKSVEILVTEDPFSATTLARNAILAAWEDRISLDISLADKVPGVAWMDNRIQYISVDQGKDAVLRYHKLMGHRLTFQIRKFHLAPIFQKFQLDNTKYLSSQQNKELRCLMIDEKRHWRVLQNKLDRADTIITDHMAMYAQHAAMVDSVGSKMQTQESQKQTEFATTQTAAANRMARTSGQLTKLATVVVPFTVVASIFSMNGDFAAGKSLFFVYWVISLPITIILLGWVLQKDILALIRKEEAQVIATPTNTSAMTLPG
jgi:uncharacterized protein YaaW (UPF0174 family)